MPLTVGSRLGHYDVTALIGEGGMGQVYQATDTKLNRQVALKILPEAFATDSDRLARFQREAQVLASLNHPNIAAIHGLEDSEGTKALVLELVEGPTLADRIAQGSIPVDEALPIAKQIAEALEAAHEQGVIHRDLKPANIKVKEDGTVKVLDFGLAKALDTTPEGDPSQSPTLTAAATQMGVIMGTAAYMSPEQARGKAVDKRADIWAFGAVLYEMLAGRRAFDGEDVSVTLASVIKNDPDDTLLPNDTPAPVRRLIRRALEKDRTRRIHHIGDARVEIEDGLSEPTTEERASVGKGLTLRWSVAVFAAGVVLASVVMWSVTAGESETVARSERFALMLTASDRLPQDDQSSGLTISPDGKTIVYVAHRSPGGGRLLRRELDAHDAIAIAGTERARWPFFSPDGTSVGFFAGPRLMQVSLEGGTPVALTDVDPRAGGASWARDGYVYFGNEGDIFRIHEAGGTPERVIEAAEGTSLHSPRLLPDGEHLLFTIKPPGVGIAAWRSTSIVVQSLDTQERHELVQGGADARYAPTGHLLYVLDDALLAVGFDVDALTTSGQGVTVVEDVRQVELALHGGADFAISDDGSLVYLESAPNDLGTGADRRVVFVDDDGHEEPLPIEPDTYVRMEFSPDGRSLALDTGLAEFAENLWIADVATGTRRQLTFDGAQDFYPVWTPDGKHVIFGSFRDGPGIFMKAADGSGSIEELARIEGDRPLTAGVSPDGEDLLFFSAPGARWDIFKLDLAGDRSVQTLLNTDDDERRPALSPDGRWMAYQSDRTARIELYVRPYPNVNDGSYEVTTEGGTSPVWTPNGESIIFRRGQSLMIVDVETGTTFSRGTPRLFYESSSLMLEGNPRSHAMSPDGRLAVLTVDENASQRHIDIVQNWHQELLERVPID